MDLNERFEMKADCPCFKHVVAIAPSGKIYRYKNPESISLEPSIIPRSKIWENYDQFAEMESSEMKALVNSREDIDPYNFIERGKKSVPKQTLGMAIWLELCKRSEFVTRKLMNTAGMDKRKANLLQRVYKIDRTKMSESVADLPTQAIACLKLMWELDGDEITEGDLRELIIKNADKLNTRQDPWRIFQYYRAKLNTAGFFRMT